MTQDELFQGLKSIGIPVAYREFISTREHPAPPPPFITYQYSYSSDLIADNQNYKDIAHYQVELYAKQKDLPTEKLVEDKLKQMRLPYNKVEAFLDSEKLLQVVYEISLIGG